MARWTNRRSTSGSRPARTSGIASAVCSLCPLGALSVSLGPNDPLLSAVSRRTEVSLGLGVAAVTIRSHRLSVNLAGSLRVNRLTAKAGNRSASDTYWLTTAGVGFVINGSLTIRPNMSVPFGFVPPGAATYFAVPFGREDGEVSLGISVGINLGRRR